MCIHLSLFAYISKDRVAYVHVRLTIAQIYPILIREEQPGCARSGVRASPGLTAISRPCAVRRRVRKMRDQSQRNGETIPEKACLVQSHDHKQILEIMIKSGYGRNILGGKVTTTQRREDIVFYFLSRPRIRQSQKTKEVNYGRRC